MSENMDELRYPIGKFIQPAVITDALYADWLVTIATFPARLMAEVADLHEDQLQQTYRDEGWTIEQLVHHCADSHMNSFIRFKLALTEDEPTIKPYLEDQWAKLPDARGCSISHSLLILQGLHARWVALLSTLADPSTDRYFIHPETNAKVSLRINAGIYAWHGEHHLAHIRSAKNRG